MSTTTEKLKLIKPELSDPANITATNENWDKIDHYLAPAIESEDYPGCYYRIVDGKTEWVNPPMVTGTEYRTTERINGNPVYVMNACFGSYIDNLGEKTVDITISDNGNGLYGKIIDITGTYSTSDGRHCVINGDGGNVIASFLINWNGVERLYINNNQSSTIYDVTVTLKYIKVQYD